MICDLKQTVKSLEGMNKVLQEELKEKTRMLERDTVQVQGLKEEMKTIHDEEVVNSNSGSAQLNVSSIEEAEKRELTEKDRCTDTDKTYESKLISSSYHCKYYYPHLKLSYY